jgi:hypothetical protein
MISNCDEAVPATDLGNCRGFVVGFLGLLLIERSGGMWYS